MDELIFRPAHELAAAIRRKEVSAVEVVQAHLAQIARHNSRLNAVVILDEEGARRRAREADAALARDHVWGPLHGVPVTLKDVHDTAGMRSTLGNPLFFQRVPDEDSAVAARIKGAGAVLLGKTNAELFPDNPFGRTHNPWDLERSASYSSSGAAAALAAGMTALDVGSDLGGSIISPAHYCGVCGMRPTERRVPLGALADEPVAKWHMILVLGPMARSMADLRLAMQIIARPDVRDTNVPALPWRPAGRPGLHELRVAWAPALPDIPVASGIRAAVEELADKLVRLGARVEQHLPEIDLADQHRLLVRTIGLLNGAFGTPRTSLGDYFALLHQRNAFIAAWERFFDHWDVLLLPAFPTTAERLADRIKTADGVVIPDDDVIFGRLSRGLCGLAAVPGCPAITMPLAQDQDGLPIGVQVIGRRWDDERLLAIAELLEEVSGGFRRPPGY